MSKRSFACTAIVRRFLDVCSRAKDRKLPAHPAAGMPTAGEPVPNRQPSRTLLGTIAAFFLCLAPLAQADIQYVYDEVGRLVQVIDANGESAQYQYDAAGNITSITRTGSGQISIAEFSPSSGPVGSQVTIDGVGFSTTPSNNAVNFNGVTAAVVSATATRLVATVPSSATAGPLTVTVGSATATALTPFTVTTDQMNPPPIVAGLSPTIGTAGTAVTITGQNFDASSINNKVRFNGALAPISSASASQLIASVPAAATSGRISVSTPYGTASSTQDFFVPPSGYTTSQVGSTARIAIDGSPLALGSGATAQLAMILFDGVQGQNVSITISSVSFTPTNGSASFYVKAPDGSTVGSSSNALAAQGTIVDLPTLPANGTYTLVVVPASNTSVAATYSLSSEITGPIAIDGAPVTFSTVRIGQNGRYSFSGTLGQNLGLGISALSTSPSGGSVAVTVYAPDNVTVLKSCGSYNTAGGNCNLPPLPSTGTYTVQVNPSSTYGATLTLTLSSDAAGTLAPNGAANLFSTTRVGQNARYTFNATAGQNLSVMWNGATFAGNYTYLYVYKPDGSQLNSSYFSSTSNASNTLDLINVPATGLYTVFVDPYATSTGQISVQLLADAPGTLAVDGAALPVNLSAGQNGRYSFNGTLGQNLGLGVSSLSTSPSGGYVAVTVYAPDNVTVLMSCGNYNTSGGNCNLPPLPSTGTYTVQVNPSNAYGATLTLTLSSDVAGTLEPNGAANLFSTTRVGQNARYTFNATAGQSLSVLWSGTTFAGNYTVLRVYKPDGALLDSASFSSTSNASSVLDLTNVQATGLYTVFVDPYAASTGQISVQLLADAPGTLAVDGASLPVSLSSGQNGRYSFSGTLGQNLGLGISGLSTTPSGASVAVTVYAPDNVTVLKSCNTYAAPGGNCNLPPLPSTGTYTVQVNPSNAYGATLTLTLSSDVAGTLEPNGAANLFSTTRVGQNARYTFNATAGQNLSVLWSGTTFAGNSTYLYVYKPDGSQLNSAVFSSTSNASGTLDLPNVPVTGLYTVFVDPYATSTGQIGVQLLADAPGTLAVDGASLPVSLSAGQNGRYSFSGTVGQNLGLGISGLSTTPSGGSVAVTVYAPDNVTVLMSCSSYTAPGGNCNLPPLPSTGSYTVQVNPTNTSAATLTLTLSTDAAGTLAPNGGANLFSTTRAGQNGRYTFNATAGQNLSVLWSGATFVGYYSYLYVYKPDGTSLNSAYFSNSNSSGSLALTNVPATGAYTVLVDPYGASTGQVGVQVNVTGTTAPAAQTVDGSVVIDGAVLAVSRATGQQGRYTFEGTFGQNLGLGISALTTSPTGGSVSVSVYAPDNVTVLKSCGSYNTAGGNCNLPPLPSTGTYTVRVDPASSYAATLSLTLSGDVAGTLEPNGAANLFSTTRVGQNARYTFNATAGQNLSILRSGGTFAGVYTYLYVYKPDGSQLKYDYFDAAASPSGMLELVNVPATGIYTVFIDPFRASTGQMSVQLLADVPGTLAVDAPPIAVNLASGQNGTYSFAGTLGQNLGLGVSGLTTNPTGGSVTVTVYAPDNVTVLKYCSSYSAANGGGNCNLPPLPSTGTYTVRVAQTGSNAAALTLTLSSDVAGTLEPNGAANLFSTTRVGQNARYTFNATAGQNLSILRSGGTFAGVYTYLYVYKPDGSQLTYDYFDAASSPSGTLELVNVPATGVYTVFIDPFRASTGQMSVQLLADAPGTLAVDGAAFPVTLSAGQNGTYTFAGTLGQNLGLGVSGLTTSPAGGAVYVYVYAPDNVTMLKSCGTYTAASGGGNCNLPPLPSTGTYTVRIDPAGSSAASLTLTLSSDVAGTLEPNGAANLFSTTRVGQNARYTFNATAGQNLSILRSGGTFAGVYTYLYIYKPDGSQLTYDYFDAASSPSGTLELVNVPATGVYTVFIDPFRASTGQMTVQLLANAPDTLAVDGAVLPISLAPGQNGSYTFAGTLGQNLGLGISALTTSPSGGSVTVSVYAPDNFAVIKSCGTYQAAGGGGNCNLPPLPSDGTYTVRVDPTGVYGATANLTLSSDVTGTLESAGAALVFSTTRVGQNGRYSFTATAGDNLRLLVSGATFVGSSSRAEVYRPDGTLLGTATFESPGTPSASLNLTNLQATGTYSVFIDPYRASTGQVSISLQPQ